MKLRIYADTPCGVFLDGNQFVTPFELDTKPVFHGQMTVLPSSPEKYSGYTLTFTVEDDRLKSLSGGACGISWGSGLGEIRLTPVPSVKRTLPEVISQKKANGTQVTLYTDGAMRLMCEGRSFFACDLPEDISDCTLKLSEDGTLMAVEGKVLEKSYLLALALSESGEWQVMHEILADYIETSDSGVTSRDVLPSMLRHEKKCIYKPFSDKPEEASFTPTVRHEYRDELIPYLFLECIMMDCRDSEGMLDSSLGVSAEGLKEFFGDIDTAIYPPFGDYGADVVAVFNSRERIAKPDLYKFEVQNSKITNIIHLLTCY